MNSINIFPDIEPIFNTVLKVLQCQTDETLKSGILNRI